MRDLASSNAWYQSSCHIDTSLWGKTAQKLPELEVLRENETTDVAIIGAGFCGLSTALHLAEEGVNVSVVDAHQPGWGASGRNGGQVIPGLKIQPDEIETRYGKERGRAIVETVNSTPQLVFDLIEKYNIDCDLRRTGWIQLAKGPKGAETTNTHIEQWAKRGVKLDMLGRKDIATRVGTNAYQSGFVDYRGGNLHPLKYARGLARACLERGVRIYKDSPAVSVEHENGQWITTTAEGKLLAEKVVVCTNGYTGNMLPGLSESIVPVLTGVVATDPLSDNLKNRILPERQGAADTQRLLSWFGVDRENRLIFGSRINSQRELIDEQNFSFGVRRMHDIFPETSELKLHHLWTGRVALTLDHVPHIHRLADGLYSGLGFNGRGVAMATMFGKILAGHCTDNPDVDNFLPITKIPRVPFSRFRGQGIAIALTWKRMMDTLKP